MNWDSKERREFVRIKFPCEILVGGSKEEIISTHAENISAGGIRVIIEKKLPCSSVIDLVIYGIRKKPILCKGKIIWTFSRKIPYHRKLSLFDTGIEFYKIKKEDRREIKSLITSIATGTR